MDDSFSQLPQGTVGGVAIAVANVTIHTGSAVATHRFPRRPGQRIEYMGREPVTGTIRAAMFAGLIHEKAGAQNVLWPGAVQRLREVVQSQKSLELVVPPFGVLPKAFVTMDEDYQPNARNGCWVNLQFQEDSTDLIQIGATLPAMKASLSNAAARADLELAAAKIANQYRMDDGAGGSVTDFVSAVRAFQYAIDSAGNNLTKPIRQAEQILGATTDLLKTSKALLDPTTWQARDALLDLFDATKRTLAETRIVKAGRAISSMVAAATTSLSALASSLGNTVEDLLALNSVPDAYDIEPGQTVYYYTS